MKTLLRWSVLLGMLCGSAWAAEKFTAEQLKALFYYDLGPAEIDVSSYPPEQKDNYKVFAKSCSQCHTLARPIHSPISSRRDWRRYVARMHRKTQVKPGAALSKNDAKAVVEFLAYDSQIRKVKDKEAFEARAAGFKSLYEELKKYRARLQLESDKKKARQAPMGAGEKPAP